MKSGNFDGEKPEKYFDAVRDLENPGVCTDQRFIDQFI
jgi:hypothetical protein